MTESIGLKKHMKEKGGKVTYPLIDLMKAWKLANDKNQKKQINPMQMIVT